MGDTTGKGTSQLDTTYVLCDGGVVANNPSAEAVAFTSIAYGKDNKMVPLQVCTPREGTACWNIASK